MNKPIQQLYRDLKSIKIQGATAVAKAIVLNIKKYGLQEKTKKLSLWKNNLTKTSNYLLSARPTEPLAQNGIKYIFYYLNKKHPTSVQGGKTILKQSTDKFLRIIHLAHASIISRGPQVIKNTNQVLTHCHSSLVANIIIQAKKRNKNFEVFNTETRPLFQGRITSRELLKAGVKTTMITDSSAGFLISKHSGKELMMEVIILGADAILSNGSVINKIGSYSIAAAAKLEKVPLYIAAPLLKYHDKGWITIERRSSRELWPQAPKKLKIINFAFDLVPAEWIKGIICEAGIIKPKDAKKYVKKLYPEIL